MRRHWNGKASPDENYKLKWRSNEYSLDIHVAMPFRASILIILCCSMLVTLSPGDKGGGAISRASFTVSILYGWEKPPPPFPPTSRLKVKTTYYKCGVDLQGLVSLFDTGPSSNMDFTKLLPWYGSKWWLYSLYDSFFSVLGRGFAYMTVPIAKGGRGGRLIKFQHSSK